MTANVSAPGKTFILSGTVARLSAMSITPHTRYTVRAPRCLCSMASAATRVMPRLASKIAYCASAGIALCAIHACMAGSLRPR
ncbi:hypothetical protein D3C72_1883160 [compost metagenome]